MVNVLNDFGRVTNLLRMSRIVMFFRTKFGISADSIDVQLHNAPQIRYSPFKIKVFLDSFCFCDNRGYLKDTIKEQTILYQTLFP